MKQDGQNSQYAWNHIKFIKRFSKNNQAHTDRSSQNRKWGVNDIVGGSLLIVKPVETNKGYKKTDTADNDIADVID